MTKEEIQNEIAELLATVKKNNAIIDELMSYGASWALDCREMQIAESNLHHARIRIFELKEELIKYFQEELIS